MKNTIRLSALASLALLAFGGAAQAQQTTMTFFVTSVGPGKGGDLGGLAGADSYCQTLAQAVGAASDRIRPLQNGFARSYALCVFVGATVIVAALTVVGVQ